MFLAPHIANHLTAIWSTDVHKSVMEIFRTAYRQSAVQSVLVGLFLFQIVGGLTLLRRRIGVGDNTIGSLQTAAGAYLAAFIASHLVAVFILGRQALHVDTNWDYAVGAPAGLMGDLFARRFPPQRTRSMRAQSGSARPPCEAKRGEPGRRRGDRSRRGGRFDDHAGNARLARKSIDVESA